MKYLMFFIPIIVIITSCNKAGKQLKERIVNADSIAINFFKGDGTMDSVEVVKIIRDRKIIDQLTGLITAKSHTGVARCGFDGSIHVFKMNMVIQDVDFSIKEAGGCNQFTFLLNGKYNATSVTDEAKELLEGLKSK